MRRDLLRTILMQESRAYGFTIAFWGSGALLIGSFGVPSIGGVLAYGSGAVIGFGVISLIAFERALGNVESSQQDYLVLSMVHYLAALAPILLTYLYVGIIGIGLMESFFLSGLSVSITYNLMMLVEEHLSERVRHIENRLIEIDVF